MKSLITLALVLYASFSFAAGGAFQIYSNKLSFPDGSEFSSAPKDGKTIYNGSGAPLSAATVGDFYLDTTNSMLYGPYNGSAWGSGVSLVGPQGIQGLKGDTGLPGPVSDLPGGINTLGGKVQRDFLTYFTGTFSTAPLHIKTNLVNNSNYMYRFLLEGYNYGNSASINSEIVGYLYAGGINGGKAVNYSTGVLISQYISSDNYLVIRLDAASFFYAGFSVSAWFVNASIPSSFSAQVIQSATNL